MLKVSALSIFILLAGSTLAVADDWTGKGELGFVQVSGNTESEVLNAAFEMEKVLDKWKHTAKLSAVTASSDDVKSADSQSAGWRSEYTFSERTFGFGDVRYFNDEFDSYEEIYTVAAGAGYKVILKDHMTWDLSAGAGYRSTVVELTEEDENGLAYLLESDYKHHLTETTDFENYTRVEIADDNTFSQNITSLAVSINSSLALKASFEIRHNSDPSPGFESVDRITSVNVVYSF